MPSQDSPVHRYHDATKHHFNRFAQSLGYLDWASQPHPFRTFNGALSIPLFPSPGRHGTYAPVPVTFGDVLSGGSSSVPLTAEALGDLLLHALGLSAWKEIETSRWSLRVNPSSGNLHPTEAYVVCGAVPGLCDTARVFHYAADSHVLEERCRFEWPAASDPPALPALPDLPDPPDRPDLFLIALTSIHWRESWKYGERAFRYCQHDLGHAIAALTYAAAMLGWRTELLPEWSHHEIAALTGIDRGDDFFEAEREEPGCVLAIVSGGRPLGLAERPSALASAAREGAWSGRANQLSEDHVQWTFIDEVAEATRDPGRSGVVAAPLAQATPDLIGESLDVRVLVRTRRSAVSFNPIAPVMPAASFFAILSQMMPSVRAPWTALWWTPRIHLLVFVHRVEGVAPGIYALDREPEGFVRLRSAIHREMEFECAHESLPLWRLVGGDARAMARRLSCDQDIAADGFFSLGMLADFDAALDAHGPSFYRHLFWESGVIGQALYLAAEAAAVRGTGIGCFYDDAVHNVLGLTGHAFQSLYHFTIGPPIEDTQLTTSPGYSWENNG